MICRKRILQWFFAYVKNANLSEDKLLCWTNLLLYFTSLSAHVSQYFSKRTAPSTLNNASLVATLPQVIQNFGFLPTSSKDLSDEKTFFSILLFQSCNVFVSRTNLFSCYHESEI